MFSWITFEHIFCSDTKYFGTLNPNFLNRGLWSFRLTWNMHFFECHYQFKYSNFRINWSLNYKLHVITLSSSLEFYTLWLMKIKSHSLRFIFLNHKKRAYIKFKLYAKFHSGPHSGLGTTCILMTKRVTDPLLASSQIARLTYYLLV